MKKYFLLVLLSGAITGLTSCEKDENNFGGIFKGPLVNYHQGKAFTWIQLSKQGTPEKLAIAIDDDVMANVPVEADNEGGGHHDHSNSVTLQLHPKAIATTPFRHVGLDWNPSGHEPDPIYTIPHFDFHYYMMDEAARLAIPPFEVNPDGFNNAPDQAYFPLNYFSPPSGVPQMGRHWIDVTSPELNGAPFTQTFIMGSYNGKVTFYEPMITRQFILDNASFERAIPQPAKFQESGYYPTRMKILKHDKLTEFILEGFEYKQKSN